jgi:hypothetical protein
MNTIKISFALLSFIIAVFALMQSVFGISKDNFTIVALSILVMVNSTIVTFK